ncbi:MAG TPA: SDR family NAD(P)-dependent oxidoreductase [Candidatus Polarisedimenticolaceae bacterium]|nr:SDR family NAD(P)-dependent oxidoreductase [Candidatus Polarisedimenticolaceae bacterium]
MERLRDRVVFVTGASSGIGAACARAFAREGARLLVAARRQARLEALAAELGALGAPTVRTLQLDVRDERAVFESIAALPEPWDAIEVLVNNAGLSRGLDPLQSGSPADWNEMIDTNVKGLLWVDRAVTPGMVARGRGTVIHLGSIAGREIYPKGNVYCATKHAVHALTAGLRLDLLGTGVRVTSVDPGLVETEFSEVRFHGDLERARGVYRGLTPLSADDVAEVVLFAATRPPHVNLAEVLLLPTDQGSANHVHRAEAP